MTSKVNFTLSKKPKNTPKSKALGFHNERTNGDDDEHDIEDEFTTIADLAFQETQKRLEQNETLTIPLPEGQKRNVSQPLLAQFKKSLVETNDDYDTFKKDGEVTNNEFSDSKDSSKDSQLENQSSSSKSHESNPSQIVTDDNKNINDIDEIITKEAEDALIDAASTNNTQKSTNDSKLTIPTSSSNTISFQNTNTATTTTLDDTENNELIEKKKFQNDLSHRAQDISVTSSSYVKVPISEFGAALLRGMGWNDDNSSSLDNNNNNNNKNNNDSINPRPVRLGLGATALPSSLKLISTEGQGSGNGDGKRYYAKKGGKMSDLSLQQKKEEEEKAWRIHQAEKMKQDVQATLQIGSIVWVVNSDHDDGDKENPLSELKRAKMIKVAGVPGLNRVLVRFEHGNQDVSVKKGSVKLITRNELDRNPFIDEVTDENFNNDENIKDMKIDSLNQNDDHEQDSHQSNRHYSKSSSIQRNYENEYDTDERHRKVSKHDRNLQYDEVKKSSKKSKSNRDSKKYSSRDDYYEDDNSDRKYHERTRKQEHKKRSRSSSIESDRDKKHHKRNKRKEDSRHNRKEEEESSSRRHLERESKKLKNPEYYDDNNDKKLNKYMDGKKERKHKDDSKVKQGDEYNDKYGKQGNHQAWLIPNIRVRVITKKIAHGNQFKEKGVVIDVLSNGTKAVLQMNNGQILEGIPERYLETALPKVGGNVIILTGENKFEKGKLLERRSDDGVGVIQLFEDMNVVTRSLDDVAEWCGSLDEDMEE